MRDQNESFSRSALRQKRSPNGSISRWLAFFCSIALFLFAVTYSLNKTVFNADTAVNEITKSVYVNEATDTLNQVVTSLAVQNNIPSTLAENLLTKDQVKTDLGTLTRNVYAGKNVLLDTDDVKNQIGQNIEQKAQGAGLTTNNTIYQSAQSTFLNGLGEYLTKKIDETPARKLADILSSTVKINRIILFGSLLATIILFLLQILSARNFWRWLHYIGLSALISGIILLVSAFLIGNSAMVSDFAQQAQQASGLVDNLLEKAFAQMQLISIWLLIFGAAGFLLGMFRKKVDSMKILNM
ncbi:hypothetical protein [Liquorilactobacillus oeni]|uniref:Uncharacterized protein n=1 Tax=Liquorilactobacillus oeni DSM 19972 TaxID=1423777 RepID=A0A0R1MJU3_9LACO|nr:hypothetical protein [Liquorilactobacillus oeni]KRL05621.1 hypothetical protein FD46_GL000365 [Liquorilactobacillus oeni DSM 19972]